MSTTTGDTSPIKDAIYEAFDLLETSVDIHEGRVENHEYATDVLNKALHYAMLVTTAAGVDLDIDDTFDDVLAEVDDEFGESAPQAAGS